MPSTQYGSGVSDAVGMVFNSLLKKKQQQVQESKQAERDLLGLVNSVSPQQMISQELQSKQAEQIDKLTKGWAELYRQKQGKLSTTDKIRLIQEQRAFQTWQQGILRGQKEASDAIESIKTRPEDFDADYTATAVSEFMKTGIAPQGGFLDISPADLGKVYGKYSLDARKDVNITEKGGNRITSTSWADINDEQLNEIADGEFLFSPNKYRIQKGVNKRFESLPQQKQMEYAAKAEVLRTKGENITAMQLLNRDIARENMKQNMDTRKVEPVKAKTSGSWKYMYGKPNVSFDDILSSEMKTIETASGSDAIPMVDEVAFGKKVNHDFVAGEYFDMTTGEKNVDNTRDVRMQDVSVKYLPTANGQILTKSQLESGQYDRSNTEIKPFFYGTKYSQYGNSRPVAVPVNEANLKSIGAKLGQDLSQVKRSLDLKDKQVQKEMKANTSLPSAADKYKAKKQSWIPFK